MTGSRTPPPTCKQSATVFDPATLAEPIVQAPLAGGPSSPELAIAVCGAGGLGFIAAGYKTPDAVREQIEAVRAKADRPFGVNIFVPTPEPADPDALAPYLARLEPEAARHGAEVGEPRFEDDHFDAKLELVCDLRPAVVSFTFGCPATQVFTELHEQDIAAWVTVTSGAEATTALAAGADGLILQGTEAGGQRGDHFVVASGPFLPLRNARAPSRAAMQGRSKRCGSGPRGLGCWPASRLCSRWRRSGRSTGTWPRSRP